MKKTDPEGSSKRTTVTVTDPSGQVERFTDWCKQHRQPKGDNVLGALLLWRNSGPRTREQALLSVEADTDAASWRELAESMDTLLAGPLDHIAAARSLPASKGTQSRRKDRPKAG